MTLRFPSHVPAARPLWGERVPSLVLAAALVFPFLWGRRLSGDEGSRGKDGEGIEAREGRGGDEAAPGPRFDLYGPNDGELVNGRSVRLRIETDHGQAATLEVSVNGVTARTLRYLPGREPASESGLSTVLVDLDLEQLGRLLPGTDLHDRSTELRFRAGLYTPQVTPRTGGELVAGDEHSWRPAAPWLEFAPSGEAPVDGGASPGADPVLRDALVVEQPAAARAPLEVLVHPLAGDSFFLLVSSPRVELALTPPDEVDLAAVSLLAGGVVPAGATQAFVATVRADMRASCAGQPVVLWTYSALEGWERSGLYTVP